MEQSLGDSDSLLHSAGKSAHEFVAELHRVGDLKAVIDSIGAGLLWEVIGGSKKIQVFPDPQGRIHAEIIREETDQLLDAIFVAGDVFAGNGCAALGRIQQAAENSEGGRFSRAVGANIAEDFAAVDLEVQV